MRIERCRALLVGLVLAVASVPAASADDMMMMSRPGLISGLLPTVVNITSDIGQSETAAMDVAAKGDADARPRTLTGSGFIIDPAGYIATNYHVVAGAYRIIVMFSDGETAPASLAGYSRPCDIALLKVTTNRTLAAIRWGDSDALQIGDPVFAVGNPLGLGLSVSGGIVSALNRNIMDTPYDHFIQTDAAINHGNSGGPLFNLKGEVIGVDTAIISPTTGSAGLGFAIPAGSARLVVDRLKQYGWLRPGWLGLKVDQLTPEIADALGMKLPEGAQPQGSIISKVFENGPAAEAGLRVGDVILRFDDHKPSDTRELLRDIVAAQPGQTVKLTVWRPGHEFVVKATIIEWPKQQWDRLNAPIESAPVAPAIPPNLGLSLAEVTDELRAKYGLEPGQTGVLVAGVMANTDAADRGLATGDVILRVQDQPVASPQAVQAAIDAVREQKRPFAAMLVLPKVQQLPGPKWMAVRVASG